MHFFFFCRAEAIERSRFFPCLYTFHSFCDQRHNPSSLATKVFQDGLFSVAENTFFFSSSKNSSSHHCSSSSNISKERLTYYTSMPPHTLPISLCRQA